MARSGGLGVLSVDLLLEVAEWVGGLSKAEREAQKFADAIDAKFKAMGANIAETMKGMAAGMIAGFSVGAIAHLVNEAQEAADRMDELAQKSGASIATLTQLGVAAEMSGGSVETVAAAFTKFNLAVVKGQDKQSDPGRVFEALGVSVTDASGKLRASEDVMADFNKALAGVEDGAVKTAAAVKVYGKAGADMIPIINQQAAMSDELKASTKALGEEQTKLAKIAGAYEEQQKIMNVNGRTTAALLAEQLIPYVTTLMKQWNSLTDAGKGLSGVLTFLVNSFKVVVIAVDLTITAVVALIQGLVGAYNAWEKIKQGKFAEAGKVATETYVQIGDTLGAFKTRLDALVNPMDTVTEEMKKQTGPTKALNAAVQDLVKSKTHLINLDSFQPLQVTPWTWMDEAKGPKIDESKITEISQRATEIRLKAEAEAYKEWFTKLKDQYGQLYSDIEGMAHTAFNNLFDDAAGGWKKMLTGMLSNFKKMLMDMIWKQVAQPLVLNLVAMIGGGSGLGQYASALGGQGGGGMDIGGLASAGQKAWDYFTGSTSAAGGASTAGGVSGVTIGPSGELIRAPASSAVSGSSLFGGGNGAMGGAGYGIVGGLGGYGAARLAGAGDRGQAAAAQYGALGAQVGSYFGPWGAAAGWAIGTVAGIATDPDPDAMRKARFGARAKGDKQTQYQFSSALGDFGISDTQWFSDKDMETTLKPFMEGLKNFDNAVAAALEPAQLTALKARLADFSKEYEFGMEHMGIGGLGEILKDRMHAVVQTVAPEFEKFFNAFTGPVEDLTRITTGFLTLKSMQDFDPEKLVKGIYEENEAKASQMGMYQKGIGAIEEQVAAFDGSAQATDDMVASLGAFQQATVAMIIAIDAAAEAMHAMFMSTADTIRKSVQTPMERYNFLQERSAKTFDLMQNETDPAKIQAYADSINRDIMEAWALLTPEQQAAQAEAFLTRINNLDTYVANKMGALHDVVVEDSAGVMQKISDKLDEVFIKGTEAANTNKNAADIQLKAANTPLTVVLVNGEPIVNSAG